MKLRVAVIFGGQSCEHEISCISANQVLHALSTDKYEVIPVYISKNSEYYTGEALFDLKNYRNLQSLENRLKKVSFLKNKNKAYLRFLDKLILPKDIEFDIAMPILHGTNGEDGTFVGLLEMLKIPYTSCNVASSAAGQDKVMMKQILSYENISICPWFWLYGFEFENDRDKYFSKADEIGYPLIIKPANLGSSIGIEIVHDAEELAQAIKDCSIYDSKLVVEKVVEDLLEVNCSVLGSRYECKTSVLEEVIKNDEILSYNDKYRPNGSKGKLSSKSKISVNGSKGMESTSRIIPAPLDDELTNEIKAMAIKTFKVLGSSGVVRIDFLIDKNANKVFVNEINNIPGSLANYLWSPLGYTFGDLLDELIKIGIDNQRRNEKMIFSFDTNILANY